jgi:hypothetical protein
VAPRAGSNDVGVGLFLVLLFVVVAAEFSTGFYAREGVVAPVRLFLFPFTVCSTETSCGWLDCKIGDHPAIGEECTKRWFFSVCAPLGPRRNATASGLAGANVADAAGAGRDKGRG